MNLEKPQSVEYSPYSAFPSYERTKMEVIDKFLAATNAWREAAEDSANEIKLQKATLKLVEWYVLVHGYTKAKPNPKLQGLQKLMKEWWKFRAGAYTQGIKALIDHDKLADYVLDMSDYMNSLGVTSILQHHKADKFYLGEGMAER